MKSKSLYWKYLLLKIKYIFLRDSYVCTRWIFIFDSDQAQINSADTWMPSAYVVVPYLLLYLYILLGAHEL